MNEKVIKGVATIMLIATVLGFFATIFYLF